MDRPTRALRQSVVEGTRHGGCRRAPLETPMPRVEIEGVGVISFPIPDSQIQDIIKHAQRAPYGRGGETILGTSVRNTWQLAPARVQFQDELSLLLGISEIEVALVLFVDGTLGYKNFEDSIGTLVVCHFTK
jgi:hypothetical protein